MPGPAGKVDGRMRPILQKFEGCLTCKGREAGQRIAEAYHWKLLCPTQGRDNGDIDTDDWETPDTYRRII